MAVVVECKGNGNVSLIYSVESKGVESLKGKPNFERYPAFEKSRVGLFVYMCDCTVV